MAKMSFREALDVASEYYEPGAGKTKSKKKDSLRRKAKMAIMGKHYKTAAAKRAIKKKKELDRKGKTAAGTRYSRDADAVLRRLKK